MVQVSANDPDGDDEALQYQLVSGARDSFVIDNKSGIITVSGGATLDRDKKDSFQVNLKFQKFLKYQIMFKTIIL